MMLAALTASGVLVSLYCLGQGTWDIAKLSWLMLKIWLGSTFLGFEAAQDVRALCLPHEARHLVLTSGTLNDWYNSSILSTALC